MTPEQQQAIIHAREAARFLPDDISHVLHDPDLAAQLYRRAHAALNGIAKAFAQEEEGR